MFPPLALFYSLPVWILSPHGPSPCADIPSSLIPFPSCMFVLCVQPQREESASYVWDLIQNCLEILGISEEEAMGLWSLLAAIYHLGFAGVRKGRVTWVWPGGLREGGCGFTLAAGRVKIL